jgi:hypothetical protein
VCCVFRQIAKIDQRQRPRRRGHEKMLRHGSRPGKRVMVSYEVAASTSMLSA